ncbi:MAG: hypothetical protein WBM07_00610 [Chitinivibrionales bacterium]
MGPYEIMMEHIEFWASNECPPLSCEDIQLISKLANVLGVKLSVRTHIEIIRDGSNCGGA